MTTPARNAQTAALEALIEAHAVELKLPTVRRRFKTMAAVALREQQTPVAYLAALLEAEMAERAERREKRRLIAALGSHRSSASPIPPPVPCSARVSWRVGLGWRCASQRRDQSKDRSREP